MERIFPDSVHAEIESFGFDSDCLLFPVRHHSPVCSYQLLRTIQQFGPDIILVEGPENANELIPVLTHEGTRLPVAFYYFFKDRKKLVSEAGEDYKCYYPFLNASPEYNALKEAERLQIPARFIDLPYGEILIGTSAGAGFRRDADRHSYADDSGLFRNKFYQKICEKTGLRSFEEFWEKYFEINGIRKTPQEFLRMMHTYCALIREGVSLEELEADGTAIREKYMAFRISEARKEYRKILVVTGGYHSSGLAGLLSAGNAEVPKLHKIPSNDQGCYPMVYSYEAADALHGYASGMAAPFFYDGIMKDLMNSFQGDPPGQTAGIYDRHTLDLLIQTAKECTKKDIPVTMSDITSAQTLMQGLSALRNCQESGMYELMDAVTSTFIKGEKTISSSMPLSLANRLATGKDIGKIGDRSHVPPLITDFESQCERLGLNYTSVVPRELELSLFAGTRGMEQSRFLHRMDYLGTGFAKMQKGPDLHGHSDRSRVREQWRYRRTPEVDGVLTDHMTDGYTLLEACTNCAMKSLRREQRSENAALVAVDCFLMGITLQASDFSLIDEIITNDGDFFSLGEALHHFDTLHNLQTLYNFEDTLYAAYRGRCFDKLVTSLPSMADLADEQADKCTSVMRLLYTISRKLGEARQEALKEALLTMTGAKEKEPTVFGSAMGILYAEDPGLLALVQASMRGYLEGSREVQKKGAKFLKGLFASARDIALSDEAFLKLTNDLLCGLTTEDFMEILPHFRLAFSYFTPIEIQQIADKAAHMYDTAADDLLNSEGTDEFLTLFGEGLDTEICRKLERRTGNHE